MVMPVFVNTFWSMVIEVDEHKRTPELIESMLFSVIVQDVLETRPMPYELSERVFLRYLLESPDEV